MSLALASDSTLPSWPLVAKTQFRLPMVTKYFILIHRDPLLVGEFNVAGNKWRISKRCAPPPEPKLPRTADQRQYPEVTVFFSLKAQDAWKCCFFAELRMANVQASTREIYVRYLQCKRLRNLQSKIDRQKYSNRPENNTKKDRRKTIMLSGFNLCV